MKKTLCAALALLCLLLGGCSGGTPAPSAAPAASPSAGPSAGMETPEPSAAPEPFDGVFDAGTLFIGDSLTHHLVSRWLIPQGYMGEASVMAACNTGLEHFFMDWWTLEHSSLNGYGASFDPEFEGMYFAEALEAARGRYDTIYFCLGANGSDEVSVSAYAKVIDYLLELEPEAVIYMQTISDCAGGNVNSELVNSTVAETVEYYEDAGESRVKLLDVNSALQGRYAIGTGVHLTDDGLAVWYDYICANSSPASPD